MQNIFVKMLVSMRVPLKAVVYLIFALRPASIPGEDCTAPKRDLTSIPKPELAVAYDPVVAIIPP